MAALLDVMKQTQTIAMLVGLVVLLLWESAHPFFAFFGSKRRERGKHALRNLILGALNAGVIAVLFVGLWGMAAIWAAQQQIGLLHWMESTWGLPTWAHLVGAILMLDAWTYVWHRLNHVLPLLWRFHRVHHHDPHVDVTTASRFHTGEIVLSSLLRVGIIVLLGVHLWELVLYEALMFAVVQFHHANVALPEDADRALRMVIVTPAMHKVHHSRWQPETDSNYSALFSFWDRIGRSFRLRKDLQTLRLGLDGWDASEDQSLTGMLRTPLRADESEAARSATQGCEDDGWR